MIIKGNYLLYTIVLFTLWFTACKKQLDLTPQTTISDDSYWKTTNDLALACNYLYNFLPGLSGTDPTGVATPLVDLYSNNAMGLSANSISDGSRLAPASSSEWTGFYKLIRAANNILEKSAKVTGDSILINKYLGEARFFRAWSYFELVKRFGDVPYIGQTLLITDSLLYAARTNKETVLDKIYADLDYAASKCPQPNVQSAQEYGRITATAALALKSRVGLFEGTWEKFHGESNANKHLQIAVDAGNAVITSGLHSLYITQGDSSYFYEFQYDGGLNGNPVSAPGGQQKSGPQVNYTYATNKENILTRLYGQNTANNIASHIFGRNLEQGQLTATKSLMDAYLFSDGLPQGKSACDSSTMQTSPATEFRSRDPRLAMTVFAPGLIFPSNSGSYIWGGGTSYKVRKYFAIADWYNQTSFVNFNIIRYAEVLLNYAEAKFELNGSISDVDLNLTINALRNRATNNDAAKLPLLTNAFATAHGLDIRTEIRRERTVELALEGLYYWDLLRWKTAETELTKALLGPKYFDYFNAPNLLLSSDGFIILEDASKRAFNPQRDYLWPLPTVEIALNNDNLVQNPNW